MAMRPSDSSIEMERSGFHDKLGSRRIRIHVWNTRRPSFWRRCMLIEGGQIEVATSTPKLVPKRCPAYERAKSAR